MRKKKNSYTCVVESGSPNNDPVKVTNEAASCATKALAGDNFVIFFPLFLK